MKKAKEGEFIKNFATIQPSLHRYICSLLPNFNEADDILQEVAIICWEKYQSYNPEQSFQAWAFGIARNKVLHSKRRFLRTQNLMAKALEDKAEQHFAASSLNHLEDKQDALLNCVKGLDSKQQKVLLLRYKNKLSSDSIAQKLQRSAEQIRTQLFRLRGSLKSCINNKLMSSDNG